jgi:hypothetical protein
LSAKKSLMSVWVRPEGYSKWACMVLVVVDGWGRIRFNFISL